MIWTAMLGCAAPGPPTSEIPAWELAYAEPARHVLLARARVSFDRSLPPHLIQPLCEQFSLVTVTRPDDWADLQRRLQLPPESNRPDLSQGIIVGILADVGQCAHNAWPMHLRAVRARAGEGWLEAEFVPGLYYPLRTAGYLELAYVPALRTVRMVRIGPRTFMIRSTAAH